MFDYTDAPEENADPRCSCYRAISCGGEYLDDHLFSSQGQEGVCKSVDQLLCKEQSSDRVYHYRGNNGCDIPPSRTTSPASLLWLPYYRVVQVESQLHAWCRSTSSRVAVRATGHNEYYMY